MTDSYLTTENRRMLKASMQMHSKVSCATMPEYAETAIVPIAVAIAMGAFVDFEPESVPITSF
jgi:hypothetical protein